VLFILLDQGRNYFFDCNKFFKGEIEEFAIKSCMGKSSDMKKGLYHQKSGSFRFENYMEI